MLYNMLHNKYEYANLLQSQAYIICPFVYNLRAVIFMHIITERFQINYIANRD
jgi:hypothetical protein